MRLLPLISAAALQAIVHSDAQQPELPIADAEKTPTPASHAPPPAAAPAPPPELIPADVLAPAERVAQPAATPLPLPPVSQLDDAFKEKPISTSAEATQRRAQWRELRNQVANDAEIKAARRKADAARTDLQKRVLLRAYYELYFGRMIALAADPGLKAYLTARRTEHLSSLPQPRVRPSPTPAKSGG
jgi:hypothetical protein